MSLSYVGDSGVYSLFGKLKKIVGNVVKDILLNKGTKGTKAKNLGKRVHYINRMIFKKTLEDIYPQMISKKILSDLKGDFRRDLIRLSSKRSPLVILKEISPSVNTHDRMYI